MSITHERRGPVDTIVGDRDMTGNVEVTAPGVGLRRALVDVLDENAVDLQITFVDLLQVISPTLQSTEQYI